MNNLSRIGGRPPLTQSHAALNSKVLSRVGNNASTRKISQSPALKGKKVGSATTSRNSSMNRISGGGVVGQKTPAEISLKPKVVEQENVRPESGAGFEELLKSTSNNIGELRTELMKLETSYLRLEKERSKPQVEPVHVSTGNPYLDEYKSDLIKELKEENHKLTLAELKLHGDFERVREQNKCLEAENVAYKDKISTERAQAEIKDIAIDRLKSEKLSLERKVLEMEKLKVESEREKASDMLEIVRKQDEVRRAQSRLDSEKEEKQRFIKDLRAEIERNSRLALDNEKLKAEGKNLVEMIESLKIELQILKRNHEETLNYIRYS